MRDRIARIGGFYPWLVAETADGRIAGYVNGSRHAERAAYHWSADVAVYLHPDFHRQGLGRRMYNILFPLLRAQGVHSLYAGISLPNEASLALHRAMGFIDVGTYREVGFKFGRWLDATWLGLSFDDPPPTTPPRAFPTLDAALVAHYLPA
jgi:phosphinothricin acetyltransferase